MTKSKMETKTNVYKRLFFGTLAALATVIVVMISISIANKQPSYVGVYFNKSWGEQFDYKYMLVDKQNPNYTYDVTMPNGSYLVLNNDGTCIFVTYMQFPKEASPHDGRCFYTIEDNIVTFNQWYTATILNDHQISFDHSKYVFEKVK